MLSNGKNMSKNTQKINKQAGFTLIEVMVVIVILAIMAGLVVPKVVGQSDKARVKTTETALATTSNAIDMFKVDNGRYPTTQEGLNALLTPPQGAKNLPKVAISKAVFQKTAGKMTCNMSPLVRKGVLMTYFHSVRTMPKVAKIATKIFLPNCKNN